MSNRDIIRQGPATALPWKTAAFGDGSPGIRGIVYPRPDLAEQFPPDQWGEAMREDLIVLPPGGGMKQADGDYLVAAANEAQALLSENERLREELDQWRPLTPEEAEQALAEAKAEPLSEERIKEIMTKALDPAYTPTNMERMHLGARLEAMKAERDRLREALDLWPTCSICKTRYPGHTYNCPDQ